MTLNNDPRKYPFILEPGFVQLINTLLDEEGNDADGGVILNFRDPEYSYESGGFHPVEICIDKQGALQYVTDFSYAGCPPFVELAAELDWSFDQGYFRQFDSFHELVAGQSMFYLWAANFTEYVKAKIFQIEVTFL